MARHPSTPHLRTPSPFSKQVLSSADLEESNSKNQLYLFLLLSVLAMELACLLKTFHSQEGM